jgi:hypothetical protein
MTKERFDKKFWLQIGKKVIFGIYKVEVTVYKTKIIFVKNEDEIE